MPGHGGRTGRDVSGEDLEAGATMRAALFDLDGTLINSERRSLAMWAMLLDSHGVAHDDVVLRGFMGARAGRPGREGPLFPGKRISDLITEVFSFQDHPACPTSCRCRAPPIWSAGSRRTARR